MSEEWIRRLIQGSAVLLAVVAAIVSYRHVEYLVAHQGGQDWVSAHLEPLSVDGLVAVASLMMVLTVREGGRPTWLQWASLAAGVLATLAANVMYGWSGGWLDAAASGWPALAFVAAEGMLVHSRSAARAIAAAAPAAAAEPAAAAIPLAAAAPAAAGEPAAAPAAAGDDWAAAAGGAGQPGPAVGSRAGRQAKRIQVPAASAAVLAERPGIEPGQLAAATGIAVRTARTHVSNWRALQAARGA